MEERFQRLRLLEALLFAATEPQTPPQLAVHFPDGTDVTGLLRELAELYRNRGIVLLQLGRGWAFRTAPDLAPFMRLERESRRRLSRAALETLAVIAYHQPVTRAEIERIRGVALSQGTLDLLLQAGWVVPRGRRRTPGRPLTWGTSEAFLDHFGLGGLDDLPGIDEMRSAGLLDARSSIDILGDRRSEGELDADCEEDPLSEDELSDPLRADFGDPALVSSREPERGSDRS